jgi:hypothetical protein
MAFPVWTSTSGNSWTAVANWSGNAVPVNGDTITFNGVGTANLTSGLANATAVSSCTLNVDAAYTGTIGVESTGTATATYLEFAGTSTVTVNIGRRESDQAGNGVALLLLSCPGTSTVNLFKVGSPSGQYPPACVKAGTATAINAYGGQLGVCVRPGEAGTLTALRLASNNQGDGNPLVRIGPGVTMPSAVYIEAGAVYTRSTGTAAFVSVTGNGASYVVQPDATGAHTNIEIADGGSVTYCGTGTITNATVRANCTLDMTQSPTAKSIDSIYADEGARILLDNGVSGSITHSGGGTNLVTIFVNGDMSRVTITKPDGMAVKVQ